MILRAALLLWAGTALAQEPRYFAGPDHPLVVRGAPGGQPVGELPPGAAPLEVSATDDGESWGRIGFGEADGWVALDALTPVDVSALPYALLPEGLVCAGVEPFWSLALAADGATYAAPDAEPRAAPGLGAATADGRFWPVMLRFDGLTALIRPAACADGMSDRTDPWTVDLLLGDTLRTGCCRLPRTR
jgi:hypothetical protein